MKPLSMLIKPASSLCNLRCAYCFYHDISSHRMIPSYGIMSYDTLEIIVRKTFQEADGPVNFAFQGGEPTLAGLGFYQYLIACVKKYNNKNLSVLYAIQTNGLVIDQAWASFLAEHKFLVGLSLDGDKMIHNQLRYDADGKGSFSKVMQTSRLFQSVGVDFNILTVITRLVARHIERIYRFYQKQGFSWLQFIPCLPPLDAPEEEAPFALTAHDYGLFLKKLFDLWYDDLTQNHYVSIRQFDNWVRMAAGQPPELCGMNGHCTCQYVIEADGSVYPCDFYVTDPWRMGQITESSFAELAETETAKRFVNGSNQREASCDPCQWLPLCRGGCRRDREPGYSPTQPNQNMFCQAYLDFFPYAWPRMRQVAARLPR